MTQEQKNRRGAARLMADRYMKRVKAELDSLPEEDRCEIRRVFILSRDPRNARALCSMAHNAGKPGPLSIAQSLAGSLAVLRGWL